MPLFETSINHKKTNKETRGTEDIVEKCETFLDIFESSFVPAYKALSAEDQN